MSNELLPSGYSTNTYRWKIENVYPKARALVKGLLKDYKLNISTNFQGLGGMNHTNKSITINPDYLSTQVDTLLHDRLDFSTLVAVMKAALFGVISHEIGHALYTLPFNESKKLLKKYSVPEYFGLFASNIVEDSYIQNKMKARYNIDLVRTGLDTSQQLFQGAMTCEDFASKEEYTAKDKLFYFILLSYNSAFAPPDGCDVPEELIDEFLSFYFISDKEERFKATCTWSEHLYEWLKEELQEEQENQQAGGDSEDSDGSDESDNSSAGAGKVSSVDEAVKKLVEEIQGQTNIGSGSEKTKGSLDKADINLPKATDIAAIASGISMFNASSSKPLSDTAARIMSSYRRHFRRLQLHTYGGLTYNMSSGKLDKKRLHKSSFSAKIFTKNLSTKRDMDLYLGITLDASGSMNSTYDTLTDIIVPLFHGLQGLNCKTEMLVFSDDTVKVKDYYSNNLSTLYAATLEAHEEISMGTDLLPSLEYFNQILRTRNHPDKCIIVVTDGESVNMEECIERIKQIRNQHTHVLGIGLRLYRTEWFEELFNNEVLMYNTDEEIQNNIAKDLTKYLANKFMKK